MKAHLFYSIAFGACLVATFAVPTPVKAIDFDKVNPLSLFKSKPEKGAPTLEEKKNQEAAANVLMQDAKTALATGSEGKAIDLYKEVTRKYRFTDSAGEAQFQYAYLLRKKNKLRDSFEAYQKVVSTFRTSTRYADAIQQQFEIAEEAHGGKKQGSLLLIPMKLDTSEIIKMYDSVVKNGPYSKFAPLSQFAIGEAYQEKGEKTLAIAAYQMVVDNYPAHAKAAEAQARIANISVAAAKQTQDASNLITAKEAATTYKVTNPTGERRGEIEDLGNQINEESALRSLSIAKYYERGGKPKAAAIYYNNALRTGTPETALKARERLTALATVHGDDLKENTDLAENDAVIVPAKEAIKSNDDYAGPPGPALAKLGRKAKMRTEDEAFKPIPLKEPELPTKSNDPAAPGMLIPPATGQQPTALPVPPPPGATPPVPPKP